MNKNLLWKIVFIVAIVLFFLYGIFGIPKSLTVTAWRLRSWITFISVWILRAEPT